MIRYIGYVTLLDNQVYYTVLQFLPVDNGKLPSVDTDFSFLLLSITLRSSFVLLLCCVIDLITIIIHDYFVN